MYLVFFEICQAEGIMALPKSVNKGGGVNYLEENQRGGWGESIMLRWVGIYLGFLGEKVKVRKCIHA